MAPTRERAVPSHPPLSPPKEQEQDADEQLRFPTWNVNGDGGEEQQQRRRMAAAAASSTRPPRADSDLAALHAQRVRAAGRVGTRRYANPCLVHIGNVSYRVTAGDVRAWLASQLALPAHVLLRDVRVVSDWRRNGHGGSKGYAFAVFTEAIYASVAMAQLDGTVWRDRTVSVTPGVRKQQQADLAAMYEAAAIKREARLQSAAEAAGRPPAAAAITYMEPHEAAMLQRLDPDLLDGVVIRRSDGSRVGVGDHTAAVKDGIDGNNDDNVETCDEDDEGRSGSNNAAFFASPLSDIDLDDDIEFDDNDDDDDDEVDGYWMGDEDGFDETDDATAAAAAAVPGDETAATGVLLNRAQRREAAKSLKKRRAVSSRGFGGDSSSSGGSSRGAGVIEDS